MMSCRSLPQRRLGQASSTITLHRTVRLILALAMLLVWLSSTSISFAEYPSLVMFSEDTQLQSPSFSEGNQHLPHSFVLATQQSFGFLSDISDTAWRRVQQRALTTAQYRFPENPERAHGVPIRWFIKNLVPLLQCPHAERLGGFSDDGAFWTCDPHRLEVEPISTKEQQQQNQHASPTCLVYSIGYSGPWELGLLRRLPMCEVHIIDTRSVVKSPVDPYTHTHWHPYWGVKSSHYSPQQAEGRQAQEGYLTMLEIRQRLGHTHRHVDIVKLDCQGCEWDILPDILALNATQILWQANGLPSPKGPNEWYPYGPNKFSYIFQALQQHGYIMFAKDHRRVGPHVALGYLRLSPDFWLQPEFLSPEKNHG